MKIQNNSLHKMRSFLLVNDETNAVLAWSFGECRKRWNAFDGKHVLLTADLLNQVSASA